MTRQSECSLVNGEHIRLSCHPLSEFYQYGFLLRVNRTCSLNQNNMKNTKANPLVITGTEYIERISDTASRGTQESVDYTPDNVIAYGYKSLTLNDMPLSKDDDKFISYAHTLAEAKQEFWSRWQQYVTKRFNRKFVPIYCA